MSTSIKSSAITAAGYVYQTMQGISLLCDWLDAPSRYVRIRFECEDDAVAPRGLDDLVAERPNGSVDLWQVKFTPADEKHFLDWNWMLEKPGKVGGRSRSNLRKWFDAFNRIPAERLGEVRLLTNRVPDTVVEACLDGGFINYTKAPDAIRLKVESELGGIDNAKRLFAALQVKHSDKGFASIEVHVTDRLRRHGTAEGIEALKNRAVHWSIQKDQPTPGGWISLEEIRATLRAMAPEPLPENFVVPAGYRVPDTSFHNMFVATIEEVPQQPIVLTGPPGRGKSTYLSKVCDVLQKKQIPFVRHHYYLSTTDRSHDRLTSFAVEESLLAQVRSFHGDIAIGDRGLAPVLSACASHYKALGKPFVVILDGLDHVWRSYGHDKRPLDEVFNQVLSCIDNLVLVVGTQPVDDAELPTRLLVEASRSTWRELPAMSSDAVLSYLRKEIKFGRLRLDVHKRQSEDELLSAAAELRTRTNGHPLHVIYATEELVRSVKALSKWNVERLAGDLSQDVRSYYGSLWHLLSASQKDVLRLVCAFEFFWPKRAFSEVAALSGSAEPEVTAVEHLLHSSAAGLKVFHESLTVFVRETDGFGQRVRELTPLVEQWLSSSAPSALRVNWLWAVQAKQDRPENLIAGLQRDWVLERLQEGYPIELFESLLADAEESALCRAQYADAYRLRHLKHRLLNSLSYQLLGANAARLKICTWKLAPDNSVIDEALASRHETSTVDVAALGIALAARGDTLNAGICGDEAYRRYLGESRFTARSRDSLVRDELLFLVKSLSTLQVIGRTRQFAVRIVGANTPQIAAKFLEALIEAKNLRSLVDVALDLPNGAARDMACDAAVRAATLAEADLTAWGEFPLMSSTKLAGCAAAISGHEVPIGSGQLDTDWLAGGYDERREALVNLAHDWFFGAAHLQLIAGEDFSLLVAPEFKDRENVSEYLNFLGEVGRDFAREWSQGRPVSFAELFGTFEVIEFPGYGRYDIGQGATDFRRALHVIAVDIHLLSSKFGLNPLIDAEELQRAMTCAWFDADEFRKQYVSGGVKALSNEAAAYFVTQQLASLEGSVSEETGVRMQACLDLCEMALRHDLESLARGLCRKTWDLALGYGQRKDSVLPDVMDALEYLADIEPDEARRFLAEVAPQVHNILEYTDGKGTRHVLWQADELLAKLHRGALVEKYREHTEAGNWSAAENSLKAFVANGELGNPLMDAVLRTGVHADVYGSLQSAASVGDAEAARLLGLAEVHIGADVGQFHEPERGSSSTDLKPFEGDVTSYDIADFVRLQADLREHFGIRGDILLAWYRYWEKQGRGSELIAALEPQLLSDACRDNDLYVLLDEAFETKRKLNGVASAFPLIVQAQLMNGGWLGPMYLEKIEKTEARLKLVAKRYPRRCDEFVIRSTFSWLSRPKHSRVIPDEIMVFFLGLQGRKTEAVQFAEAMVQCVQGDTRTLPLIAPEWARPLAAVPGDDL
ncbi:MAG: NACHT domain-containing protein [Halobacteriota archaeon]